MHKIKRMPDTFFSGFINYKKTSFWELLLEEKMEKFFSYSFIPSHHSGQRAHISKIIFKREWTSLTLLILVMQIVVTVIYPCKAINLV